MATQFGRSLLMVCAILAFSFGANAQSKDTDTFHFSLGAGAEITDNRDSLPDDQAEDNTDFFIIPRFDATIFGEASLVIFHYEPQYRLRSDPSDIQNDTELFHDLGVDIKTKGAVTDLRLIEQFNITDDPAIESAGETLRRDSSFMMNRLELGMTHDFSDRTMFDLEGNHMVKSYDDEERAQESDQSHLGITGTLSHKLSPETLIAGLADASSYAYENSDTYQRDFDSVLLGGGLDHIFSPGFRGGMRAGLQSLEYQDDTLDSQSLPFLRVAITAGQAPALRLNTYLKLAEKDSDVYPFASQEEVELYSLLECNVGASRTTVLGLAATIRTDSFDTDKLPEGGAGYLTDLGYATSGDKKTLVLEGSVVWYFGEMGETNVKLAQRMEDVSSDVSIEYTRNSTSLFVTRQF